MESADKSLYASELANPSGDTGNPFRILSVSPADVASSLAIDCCLR